MPFRGRLCACQKQVLAVQHPAHGPEFLRALQHLPEPSDDVDCLARLHRLLGLLARRAVAGSGYYGLPSVIQSTLCRAGSGEPGRDDMSSSLGRGMQAAFSERPQMNRTLVAAMAVMALSAPAFAQSTTVTTTAPVAGPGVTVTIAPEQRTRIKQYVTRQKVAPVTVKERLTVGATLPTDVELHAVPSDWGPDLGHYRYVYSGSDVVLVEPSSRRIIQVID